KEINITKIVLHNGTIAYDYTKALEQSAAPLPFSVFSGNAGSGFSWFGFAAHDPRQNLNGTTFPATGTIADADWKPLTPSNIDDPTAIFSFVLNAGNYEGKPNAENSSNGGGDNTDTPDTTTGVADTETGLTDPVNLSTAFIRNAPMESPWELGFIHRGAKWQTINLKKHDRDKAIKVISIGGVDYIPGGGLYADGDANILDQIKMTADAESPQKISIKSPAVEVFEALFSKVKYGCDIDDTDMNVMSMAGINPTTEADLSGDELDAADATAITTIGNNIINKYKVAADVNMRTRSSVVDKLLLPMTSPAITADTDAEQEELIGKIINLTKIGSQGAAGGSGRFTIIVLAQTIKDVGGDSVDISMTKISADETTTQTKTDCRIGTFDAVIDLTNPERSVYFDEITSQQKIMITGTDTSTGIKITSFQYID
ncbi:MAG: hypothetical protein KAS17_04110, partial [Victivallaceae bacterium]|nr:hypothetical protein [Victivallaceae bacterium]